MGIIGSKLFPASLSFILMVLLGSFPAIAADLSDSAINDSGGADELIIIDNGVVRAVIIVDQDASLYIKRGAETLVEYIRKSTGAELPIMTMKAFEDHEGELKSHTQIHVGRGAVGSNKDILNELKELDDQGFLIHSRGKSIIIVGPTIWGTLNGVHEFLERYVGVRWLMQGPVGEDVPQHTNITVPRQDVREEPAFTFRHLNPFSGGDPYNPFIANRAGNLWAHRNKLQGNYNQDIKYGHNLHTLFPQEEIGKYHPEFYAKGIPPEAGERQQWQPCFSVKGTVDMAASRIIDYFERNPDQKSYSLGVNDRGGYCEADPSHPAFPGKRNSIGLIHMSEIYYKWVNDVVEKVSEVYPNKWYGLYAYQEVMDPPSFPLHPRVIPMITKDRMTWIDDEIRQEGHQQMEAWNEVASQTGWYDYMYGFLYYVPRPFPRLMADNMRYAKDNGVTGFRILSEHHAGDGPKGWLISKLLWDPYQDIDALLSEWYERAVGSEAATDLAQFYNLWEDFWMVRAPKSPWFSGGKRSTYLPFTNPSYLDLVSDYDIKESKRLLKSVVSKAKTTEQKERAELILRAFEFHEASALSYPRSIVTPTDDSSALALLDQLVNTFDNKIHLAERRYEIIDDFTYAVEPNLKIGVSDALWDYWWTDWTGWDSFSLRTIVNYMSIHEHNGGVVTDRVKELMTSEIPHFRQLAYFIRIAQDDYVETFSLTQDSSFEERERGVTPWILRADRGGSIERTNDISHTGDGSLLFNRTGRGSVSQVIDLDSGLTAAQVHYYTPPGTTGGTIQLELRGISSGGASVSSFLTPRMPLSPSAGEWSSLEIVEAIPSKVSRQKITGAEIVVTINGAQTTQVYLDDLVVYQEIPAGAKIKKRADTKVDRLPNIALGKPTTTSSVEGVYSGDKAVDGIWVGSASRWVTEGEALPPHWLEIDLQGTFVLHGAAIISGFEGQSGHYSVSEMKLQYWHDDGWVDIPGGSIKENTKDQFTLDFEEPITTDKVRFYSEVERSGDQYALRIREIIIYGLPIGSEINSSTDERTRRSGNVALGKPTTGSSSYRNWTPNNAVDGNWIDSSSRWLTDAGAIPPHWLEIDLQREYTLEGAEYWTGVDGTDGRYAVRNMKLEYWTKEGWLDIPGSALENNSEDFAKVSFTLPVVTNKVRFYTEDEQSPDGLGLRIREIIVYGRLHD